MATRKRETVYMTGKLYWAKVFGAPRPNYNEDGREWTFEFEPNEEGVATLKAHGLSDRLRDRSDKKGYEDRGKFIILKRKELDFEGNPNDHIRVVDAANQTWDATKMLGNGTEGDVKVSIVDYGPGKKQGIYPVAIRVLELVPYETNEFAPLDSSDPRVKAAKKSRSGDFEKDFGLEEEAPFDEDPKPSRRKKAVPTDDELDDDMPAE